MLTYTGPRFLLLCGLIVALPGIALALLFPPEGGFSLAQVAAPFLFGFGCFKGALAIDTLLRRRRDPRAAAELVEVHGSQRALSTWIAYKFAAMAMAYIAAAVCLVRMV